MTGTDGTWVEICRYDRLVPDRGVCALVGDEQVVVFLLSAVSECPEGELRAVANYDPFSKAFVLSRGIVGSKDGVPKVASPVFKQSFDLRTGSCIDDPAVRIPVFEVRVRAGVVEVALAPVRVPPAVQPEGAGVGTGAR